MFGPIVSNKTKREPTSSLDRGISRRRFICLSCAGIIAPLFLPACKGFTADDGLSYADRVVFGNTYIWIAADCPSSIASQTLDICEGYDRLLSTTIESSDIGKINGAMGRSTVVSAETAALLERAMSYSQESNGIFDVTIGALSSLWDFKNKRVPSDSEIEEAVAHVGFEQLVVEGNRVTLTDPCAKIDLGGIAKGFIADRAILFLLEHGCENAMLDLGGNIYAIGNKPSGEAWTIGLHDPVNTSDHALESVRLRNASLVTSGVYEQMFYDEGRRFHHILNPRTGYPFETDVLSSTVMSDISEKCDVLATWLVAAGVEESSKIVGCYEVESLIINKDGEKFYSDNMNTC